MNPTSDELRALLALGAGVTVSARRLTAAQLTELVGRAAQTNARLTITDAIEIPQAHREALAYHAGPHLMFIFEE